MLDLMGEAANLLTNPRVWERLMSSGFFFVDLEKGLATPSRFMASLGYEGSDFVGGAFQSSIHPADRPTHAALWARVADGQENEFFAEYRVRTKKGGYRWVQTLCIVVERLPSGQVAKMFGLDRDIGLRKQSEILLHSRFVDLERRYLMSESLRIAGSLVTASLDIESTVPVILEQAQTLFPFTGARVWAYRDGALELLGQDEEPGTGDFVSPSTGSLVLKVAHEMTPLIIDNLASRMRLREPAPQVSWIGIPLLFQGEARGVMEFWHEQSGFFRSEHIWPAVAFADNVAVGLFNARQYRATQEASETDPLTGLATRARLERLGPKIFHHALTHDEDLAVFMVDVDHFKRINDTFGHGSGDEVLRHFAQTCQGVLRKGDLMCRYGGDEFVALLPQTGRDAAVNVAQRILELFRLRDFPFDGTKVTLSLGIATLGTSGAADLKGLLGAADAALYRVKARGRDGIAV